MVEKRRVIEIYLDENRGINWHIKGPEQGVDFYIKPLRRISSFAMAQVRHLPVIDKGRIIVVCLSPDYIVGVVATVQNPNVQVSLLCFDKSVEKILLKKVKKYKNIEVLLVSDMPSFPEEIQAFFMTVDTLTDRIFSFDLLERFISQAPLKSLVNLALPTLRKKDFANRLQKYLGNLINYRFKGGLLVYGLTKKSSLKWTSREAKDIMSVQEGKVIVFSRPNCGYNSVKVSGLALAESVDFVGGETILEYNGANGVGSLLLARRMQVCNKLPKKIIVQDSRIRSIDMCSKNANENNFNFLNVCFEVNKKTKAEIILIHPKHFKDFSSVEKLLATAYHQLKSKGKIYIVSKHYAEYKKMAKHYGFNRIDYKNRRGYDITICQKGSIDV